jgi:hypothetical protein
MASMLVQRARHKQRPSLHVAEFPGSELAVIYLAYLLQQTTTWRIIYLSLFSTISLL